MSSYNEVGIDSLMGKTITDIMGMERGVDEIVFTCSDGTEYRMYHEQDCCEGVWVEDVCGEVETLLNSPILRAEERVSGENPPGYEDSDYPPDSFTWTFYELATIKGSVTLRWYGESNGYYSEEVTFAMMT